MVHTFEIRTKTTLKKGKLFLEKYASEKDVKDLESSGKTWTYPVKNPINLPGINKLTFRKISDGEVYSDIVVELVIEPENLIRGCKVIDLYVCSDKNNELLKERLEQRLIEMFPNTSQARTENWHMSRIDYAINLVSENVPELVKLFKYGKDPYRYKEVVNRKGSAYREGKSVRLNFYDKYDHISKKDHPQREDLLEQAKNILRIEVQCLNSDKLKNIREKHGIGSDVSVYDYLNKEISEDIISFYYLRVAGSEDYYCEKEAKKIIESSGWRKGKKARIMNFLKVISQIKNVSKAREQFVVEQKQKNPEIFIQGSQGTFYNYLRDMKKIGINPVLIPKSWHIKKIENPFSEIY